MSRLHSPKIFKFMTIIFMVFLCLLFNYLTQINWVKIELPKGKPEYIGQGARGIIYAKNGNILYNLVSQKLWQYPHDELIYMSNIKAIVYSETLPHQIKYNLTADNGWVKYTNHTGFLGDHAILIIPNDDNKNNDTKNTNSPVTIYGKNINLDFTTNKFTSKEDVKAVQNRSMISGHGFNYDKNTEILTINSKVIIDYLPQKEIK